MAKYKKGSAWARKNWDQWSFGRKSFHIVWVIVCLSITLGMVLGFAYLVLIYFGVLGFLLHVRDEILLAFAHWVFD